MTAGFTTGGQQRLTTPTFWKLQFTTARSCSTFLLLPSTAAKWQTQRIMTQWKNHTKTSPDNTTIFKATEGKNTRGLSNKHKNAPIVLVWFQSCAQWAVRVFDGFLWCLSPSVCACCACIVYSIMEDMETLWNPTNIRLMWQLNAVWSLQYMIYA